MASFDLNLTTSEGISYALVQGFPKIDSDSLGVITAQEEYIIKASDWIAFYLESIPPPEVLLTNIVTPNRRPMPGASFYITSALSAEPFSGQLPADPFSAHATATAGTFDEHMRVRITYETVKQSVTEPNPTDAETFLERSISTNAEFLYIPSKKTTQADIALGQSSNVVGSPNKDSLMPISKVLPGMDFNYRWNFVMRPHWANIMNLLGHVNSTVSKTFFNAEQETVMFMGVSGSQKFLWDGATTVIEPWSLDFKFSMKRVRENGVTYGWNHVWSPDSQRWMKLLRSTAPSLPLQESSNFEHPTTGLFVAGPILV